MKVADTTGMTTPREVTTLLEALLSKHLPETFSMHFHDKKGSALRNMEAAFTSGIRTFDSALLGMGGCPATEHPQNNLATEDLAHYAKEQDLNTNIDLKALNALSLWTEQNIING